MKVYFNQHSKNQLRDHKNVYFDLKNAISNHFEIQTKQSCREQILDMLLYGTNTMNGENLFIPVY